MKLRSLRVENTPQLMIIPMIDIIFFLLVFFMLSTLYMTEQRTIPVQLPAAASALQDPQLRLTITVLPDGRTYVDQEEVPLTLLRQRIALALSQQPDASFSLRADQGTDYAKVVAALDELKAGGARRIALAGSAPGR